MFLFQFSILFFLLQFIFLTVQVLGSSLDCNFNWIFCCWMNRGDGVPWQIYHGKSFNQKNGTILNPKQYDYESGQFFLATSVTPEQQFSSDWTSCTICSETGLFTVLIRAYQTPKTRIKLCWKVAGSNNSIYRHCAFLRNWRSSNYVRKHFTAIAKQPIEFYIKLQNHGQSKATAIIGSVKIVTDECHSSLMQPKQRQVKLYSVQRMDDKRLTTKEVTTSQQIDNKLSTIPPNSNSSNILVDIFGDAFAQFLMDDSDGLIVEDEKFENSPKNSNTRSENENELSSWSNPSSENRNHEIFVTRSLVPELPPAFNFLKCNTIGGCLFDRSMCSYQNSPMSRGSIFQRVRLSNQNFMQALTTPNTIAILETDTSFTEDHKIVFDFLEYTEGQRLYGCCYNTKPDANEALINIRALFGGKRPSELFCPFATAAHSTLLLWRTERFTCPKGTKKILFMCENNGEINGACAMDNIRIHKLLDVLEIEPCQKDIIAFS